MIQYVADVIDAFNSGDLCNKKECKNKTKKE